MGVLDAPSEIKGRFRLMQRLGEGERKRVYLAEDTELGVPVAVALVPASEAEIAISKREQKLTARLRSCPNVVTIFDAGQEGEWCFIISEFMGGGDLDSLLGGFGSRDPQLPIERVVEIGRDVANALAGSHARGVLHLDVQPKNIWFDRPDGSAHLGDFDLAVTLEEAAAGPVSLDQATTAAYMPPEQITESLCDARSDLYSLGATLFHALTGAPPFSGNAQEVREQHVEREPHAVSEQRDDVPIALDLLIANLLSKRPEDRLAGAEDVRHALDTMAALDQDKIDLDRELAEGETDRREFKPALIARGDENPTNDEGRAAQAAKLRELEFEAAKTLAGFMNRGGGTLLIGVSDAGQITGLESDFAALGKRQGCDGWEQYFRSMMMKRLGQGAAMATSVRFADQDGKTVAIIRCRRGFKPTWTALDEGKDSRFFVRNGNTTVHLSPEDAGAYVNREWPAFGRSGSL